MSFVHWLGTNDWLNSSEYEACQRLMGYVGYLPTWVCESPRSSILGHLTMEDD